MTDMDAIQIGQKFYDLTVVEQISRRKFRCRCICGKEIDVLASRLLNGHKKSCGCRRMRPYAEDITGIRSGKLVAIEPTEQKRRGETLWRCQCDCGKELLTEPYRIRNGKVLSCGCSRKGNGVVDIAGRRFGKLTAIRRLDEKQGSSYLWECRCDCGRTIKKTANALLHGNLVSCGCAKADRARKTIEKIGAVTTHLTYIDGTCIERLESSKKLRSDNSSGYVGVQARGDKWLATIGFKGKHYYLGMYSRIEDAVKVRRRAEEQIHDAFLEWYYANYPEKVQKGATKQR